MEARRLPANRARLHHHGVPGPLPEAADKAAAVQQMFDRIAPRYDRVNRVMTLGTDMRWRREVVRRLRLKPGERVLDLACGTGDFLAIAREITTAVTGLDFSGVMLTGARRRHGASAALVQGDAQRLPFGDGCFDAAVSGFALRNFASLPVAFAELARVLRPGARFGLLEVDRPDNRLFRSGHSFYFNHVVPVVGGVLSSDMAAYRYLPASAAYLPAREELLAMLRDVGFTRLGRQSFMLGAAQAVYGVKA
jgi:demethylmenaquinone methyltransferase/2-methoxy-6-polyprenyl-1,4-benzoquinol methylase